MISDFTVAIEFTDRENTKSWNRIFRFDEYTNMLDYEIKQIISEVEESFSDMNEGNPKEEWTAESQRKFANIRHHLLDQSNAIGRLPQTLRYKGNKIDSMSIDEWLKGFFKEEDN